MRNMKAKIKWLVVAGVAVMLLLVVAGCAGETGPAGSAGSAGSAGRGSLEHAGQQADAHHSEAR